jgi:uncharacterized protein (TIGR00255 family)
MIRSMTGFGEAERLTGAGRLRAEVKTVNHRYFSANVRLPQALDRHEPRVRDWLRSVLARGHVNCSIRLHQEGETGTIPGLRVDEERAAHYLRLLRSLRDRLDVPGEIDMALLSRFGDLIVRDDEEEPPVQEEDLRLVTQDAAARAIELRLEEGRRLAVDLLERLAAIEASLGSVQGRAPARLVAERDRLRAAVAELAGQPEIDPERVAREVAFLAERWDISEELVRLRSHMDLFRQLVAADDAEPVGKRLGFLVQEMHREANTIAAKANDAAIAHEVVAIKNEIERLREQVENVE